MGALAHPTKEVARICGMSYRTVLTAMDSGELAYFIPAGLKRKRFVRDSEMRRWLRSMEKSRTGASLEKG